MNCRQGSNPEFTGRENIYLKCNIMGMNEKEIKQVEDPIIDFAELGDYIDQPVRTLLQRNESQARICDKNSNIETRDPDYR